jgi:hypothetical protein
MRLTILTLSEEFEMAKDLLDLHELLHTRKDELLDLE